MASAPRPSPYRKSIRPVTPSSLPQFIDTELDRVSLVLNQHLAKLDELGARITAGGL